MILTPKIQVYEEEMSEGLEGQYITPALAHDTMMDWKFRIVDTMRVWYRDRGADGINEYIHGLPQTMDLLEQLEDLGYRIVRYRAPDPED